MATMKCRDKENAPAGSTSWEATTYRKISAALRHPDCPILCMDTEADKMAKHITNRLCRNLVESDE